MRPLFTRYQSGLTLRLVMMLVLVLCCVVFSLGLTACTDNPPVDDPSTATSANDITAAPTYPADTDPADTDPADTDLSETDPAESTPTETVPGETSSDETDPCETDPVETQPAVTDLAHAPVRSEPIPCENITLNAYFVPMHTQEVRDEMLRLCRDADIDLISNILMTRPWVSSDHTFAWYKQCMADADRYGLKLQTRDINVQNTVNLSDTQIRALAEKYKDLPGFGGFFIVDEPYNPNPYARVENLLREVCPNTYINVNFLPGAAYPARSVYLRQLCDYGGLLTHGGTLSMDCYCFPEGGGVNEHGLFSNYEDLREAGLLTSTNTAVYVQSVGLRGQYRTPSGSDLRYNMMAALAYGVKEIKFFTWTAPIPEEGNYTVAILDYDSNPTELYYEVVKINQKIHAIGTHLAACDATFVYHSRLKTKGVYDVLPDDCFVQAGNADIILSLMEERKGDGEYLFVVNKDFTKEQTVTLTFKGLSTVYLVSDEAGELTETALKNGAFTLTLAAGDSALIQLPAGDFIRPEVSSDPNLALHAPVMGTSSAGQGDYYLYNLTDGIVNTVNAARVAARNGELQTLTVDLGGVKSINRIDLYPAGIGMACGAYNPTDFSILVSADGVSWVEVVKNTEPLPPDTVPVFRFDDTDARYVRICIRGLKGMNGYADIGELMVYSDDGSIPFPPSTSYEEQVQSNDLNIALGKTPIASGSGYENSIEGWGLAYITDGSKLMTPQTGGPHGWVSQGVPKQECATGTCWCGVDLGAVHTVNEIHVYPRQSGDYFPLAYAIQISLDGEDWETVYTAENDTETAGVGRFIKLDSDRQARFVRIVAHKLTGPYDPPIGGYLMQVSEMEIYWKGDEPDDPSDETVDPDVPVEPERPETFVSDVQANVVGAQLVYTDLADFFTIIMPTGFSSVETYNDSAIYNVTTTAEMYARMNGTYAFTVDRAANTNNGWMFVRGYHSVVSDEIIGAPLKNFFGNNEILYGGAGMYATIGDADGRLYLMFKVYNPAAYGSIDMIIYSTPVDTESNVITFTDDGEVVTVYIDDKIYATVTLFGEITYDNIKAENCAPGNVFVQSATIVLADGQTHTVENTLIAAHVENSELGIVARDGYFAFNGIKVDKLDNFVAPEIPNEPETDPEEPEADPEEPETDPEEPETDPEEPETDPVEPEVLGDVTKTFASDVHSNEVGTLLVYTDLADYFTVTMPLGVSGVDTLEGNRIYGVSALAEMYAPVDGRYVFSVSPVAITTNGWLFVRGYHRVVSDEILAANSYIDSYYGNDYILYGGSGIYVTYADGTLYVMFKIYNPTKYGSADLIIFTTALDSVPTQLDVTDDGETVTVYVNGKVYATITLSGEITYDNIKAENCAPGNVFVQSATIVLADGQTHTVENTLIAARVENSELGIVARDGYFTFSEIKVDKPDSFVAPAPSDAG